MIKLNGYDHDYDAALAEICTLQVLRLIYNMYHILMSTKNRHRIIIQGKDLKCLSSSCVCVPVGELNIIMMYDATMSVYLDAFTELLHEYCSPLVCDEICIFTGRCT